MKCNKKNHYILHSYLSTGFGQIGKQVGRHPLYFIFIPVLFTFLMALGFLKLKIMKDSEYLYFPINGKTVETRSEIERLFPENNTDFDFTRMTRLKGTSVIIASSKNGSSMLQESVFEELQMIHKTIVNMNIQWGGQNLTYIDVCRKTNGTCYKNEILYLRNKIQDIKNRHLKIKYPIEINSMQIVKYAINMGGVLTDKEHFVKDFKAVRLIYFIDISNSSKEEIAMTWEEEFVKVLSEISLIHLQISKMCGITIDNEFDDILLNILLYIIISGVLMVSFGILTCMTTDWISSKPLIGISAFLSPLLGIASAFGLIFLCGMKFFQLHLIVPMIVLGIGLDDSFVLLAAWRRTNPEDSVEKRMSESYSEASLSITITSLTNIICGLIGLTTPFNAVRLVSITMAISMLMDYLYQVTFFGGCLALDGYREGKKLHSLFFISVKLNKKQGFLRYIKYGCYSRRKRNENVLMKCYKDKLGELLSDPKVKIIVILSYILYLSGGIYFLKYVSLHPGVDLFYHKDSYVSKYLRDDIKYYSNYRDRIQIVIDTPIDYSDRKIQSKIEKLTNKLENSPHMAGSNFTESWLRLYLSFIDNYQWWISFLGYNVSNIEDFTEVLHKIFLKLKFAQSFQNDILFNENETKIVASRFFVQTSLIDTTFKETEVLINLWNLTETSDLSVRPFNYRYVYLDIIFFMMSTIKQSITVSSCLIIFIFVIFIPNLFCAICIGFTIVSTEVITIGYMSLWDVNVNPPTFIILIMITGYCIDYSAHISYAFINSKRNNSNEKLKDSLHAAGHAVVQGCITTLLGIVAFIFAPYKVFNDLCKSLFLLIASALLHGLIILPVVLSLWDSLWSFLHEKHNKSLSNPEEIDVPNVTTELFATKQSD